MAVLYVARYMNSRAHEQKAIFSVCYGISVETN